MGTYNSTYIGIYLEVPFQKVENKNTYYLNSNDQRVKSINILHYENTNKKDCKFRRRIFCVI